MARVKGIVLDICNDRATILTEQGEYKGVKIRQPIQIGEIWQESTQPFGKFAVAAAILLILVAGGLDFFSVKAYARVTPGIELGLNRWDRVISVKPLDKNNKQLIENLNLKGKTIDQAVCKIVENTRDNSLVAGKQPTVTVKPVKPADNNTRERILNKVNKGIHEGSSVKHLQHPNIPSQKAPVTESVPSNGNKNGIQKKNNLNNIQTNNTQTDNKVFDTKVNNNQGSPPGQTKKADQNKQLSGEKVMITPDSNNANMAKKPNTNKIQSSNGNKDNSKTKKSKK